MHLGFQLAFFFAMCRGTGPSPRSNHVAALCDDKMLLIFGGASKSRTLNDLYSLDFETVLNFILNNAMLNILQPDRSNIVSILHLIFYFCS